MSAFKLSVADLVFVLRQIKIAEANAAGTPLTEIWVDKDGNIVPAGTPGATLAVPSPMSPYGLRTVDGTYNNIVPGRETWGAADQVMPRMFGDSFRDDQDGDTFDANGPGPGGLVTNTNYANAGNVADADPRIISNLIADQSVNNPAAVAAWFANPLSVAAWEEAHPGKTPVAPGAVTDPLTQIEITNADLAYLPNISPDIGLSPSFNAWMTFFGQFFDHGLDLISKGGNGTVYVPLQADDPLVTHGPDGIAGTGDEVPPSQAFMVLTRSTPINDTEARNTTTPFVDQNQTYTSHPSHQVFLREYKVDANGKTVATGHLLNGAASDGLPTWAEVKAQARTYLGIELDDRDVTSVPLVRTDLYGKFIPDPVTGFAQIVVGLGDDGIPNTADDIVVSGTAANPINTWTVGAVRTGHAFLDDIAHNAAPVVIGGQLVADADAIVGNAVATNPQTGQRLEYDDELLGRHFVTGDGRGNENIGLTTVHHIFHSEHNRQVEQQKLTLLQNGDAAFLNEWLLTDISQAQLNAVSGMSPLQLTAFAQTLNWDGERLFQAGRFATEMQYQHLVFEEFARRIQPAIDPFVFNSAPDINPAIFAEFAHTVYRFGHSMLADDVPRLDANGNPLDPGLGLIEAFLNPVLFDHDETMSADEAAGSIVRGMTIEAGNEIDEFVVNALRNNLLGLPLDLPALNIARGRDAGVATLNEARQALYASTSSPWLKPYANWVEFATNLKTSASVVNFLAAYGRHPSIVSATTLEAKRDAAMLLVFGNIDVNGDNVAEVAPADRIAFLTSAGAWNAANSGLNEIDLWIGGLAEKIMPFGGMLGSTFSAVFEAQLENLQDGDRFYYLTRTQGQNLLTSLEQNAFSKMILANTDLSLPGPDGIRGTPDDVVPRHIGIDSFLDYDYVLEVNAANQEDYDPDNVSASGVDPVGADPIAEALGLGMVNRGANYLKFVGENHVVLGGSSGNDTLLGSNGIDALWGDDGDDRLDAGNEVDLVNGGGGNDVITDPGGGDGDFLKGDEGNDVIANGSGADILMGGNGTDAIFMGVDAAETFAGQDDDFVLGGAGQDLIMGNEGNDWLEAGPGFDTTAGDNSELNFDSRIIGHDVMFAGTDEHDFDGESGDDIMVQGESVMRNEGMFGFDWATYKGVNKSANADMGIPIFTTEAADILRNRFDKTEGLSGWDYNDTLTGDDRVYDPTQPFPITALAGQRFQRDELNQAGIERIDGLNQIVTSNEMFSGVYGSDWSDRVEQIFSGGNILLGGGGSDVLTGRAGNDILDGDRWLNVRIRITAPGAESTAANQIATIDSMQHVFTAQSAGANTSWIGKSLYELLVDRVIRPDQLHIVREIIEDDGLGDVDVAVFWDVIGNYDISTGPNGTVIVSHVGFGTATPLPTGFKFSDGVDTLRNIERIRFGDGNGGWIERNLSSLVNNSAATGAAVISNLSPVEGNTLTVDTSSIQDQNGLNTFSRQWQSSADGVNWTNIAGATGTSLAIANLSGMTVTPLAGRMLRVVVSFTDDLGFHEQVVSASTAPVGLTWTAVNSSVGVTFTGFGGGDVIIGSSFVDTLNGAGGNDTLSGGAGADNLNGGDGNDQLMGGNDNDVMNGGAGNDVLNGQGGAADVALFNGAVASYRYTTNGDNPILTDTVGTGGVDEVNNTEILRIAGTDYAVRMGTNGVENFAGQPGSQIVFGRLGNDALGGGTGNDIMVGGSGNDTIDGGADNDFIIYHAGSDNRDVINGGSGTDTFVLHGANGAETFNIYTKAAYALVNPIAAAGLAADTEIVITRNGTSNGSIIAELDNIEEIIINSTNTSANDGGGLNQGNAGGDTVSVFGDFTTTSLDYSTITINGSNANDTVDITGLTSDHRVVFTSNGGSDTVVGDVRTQDVFNGITNDQRVQTTAASSFGASDGLDAMIRSQMREIAFGHAAGNAEGMVRGMPLRSELGGFGMDDPFTDAQMALDALVDTIGRTMIDTPMNHSPLDLAGLVGVDAYAHDGGVPTDFSYLRMVNPLASQVDFLAL